MASIGPELGYTQEYLPQNIQFYGIMDSGETQLSIRILSWTENRGIEVDKERGKFTGHYSNTFDYGTDRLLYRKGNEWSYLDSWDDIDEPNRTDIYLWKCPTTPITISYEVELVYQVKSESGEGGGGSTTTTQTLVETKTHIVYPNYDVYAEKLREQIAIRRETWLE